MAESAALVPVPVGACRCPGEPHEDGDVVFLYPKLGMDGGIAVQTAVFINEGAAQRVQAAYIALVDHGIADWTFSNGTGEKIPISPATIRGSLPWMEGGSEVAMAAFNLYADVVRQASGIPLAGKAKKRTRATKSSPRGRTSATST
jgi:hypothetical protein